MPGSFRNTLRAKNRIERLFPEPCVCQKTPSRPWFCFSLVTAAMVRLTPRYWWFLCEFLDEPFFLLLESDEAFNDIEEALRASDGTD